MTLVCIWNTISNVLRTERLDLRCVACALVEFCVREKKNLLGIPELGGVSSWLDSLMKFQFSANRANIRVACLNPEIWWFLQNRYLSDWTYF